MREEGGKGRRERKEGEEGEEGGRGRDKPKQWDGNIPCPHQRSNFKNENMYNGDSRTRSMSLGVRQIAPRREVQKAEEEIRDQLKKSEEEGV